MRDKLKTIDTSRVKLPFEIDEIRERLAENVHNNWAIQRMKEGWTFGDQRDDEQKKHPCLVSYSDLPDYEKEYDRKTSIETLKAIYALGYRIVKSDSPLNRKHFISYSRNDKEFVDTFRARLEASNLRTWYDQRNINDMGEWERQIHDGLAQSDVFILVVSANSLESEHVRKEVDWALSESTGHFEGRIIPVLIDPAVKTRWTSIHRDMGRYQLYSIDRSDVALSEMQYEVLLRALGVKFPPKLERYGDLFIPVYIYVGGDGITRYQQQDIIADLDNNFHFQVPVDVEDFFEQTDYIRRKEAEAKRNGQNFTNGDQIRLNNVTWGSPETREFAGEENRPLRLYLGWTKYFQTHMTNFATDEEINPKTKETVEARLFSPIEEFSSLYSDPFTTNLSVVTSDGYIYVKTRSKHCAGNPGNAEEEKLESIQPAVSGSGSPKDVINGQYDPFRTALREAREEIVGTIIHDNQIEITFFGLARIWRTRFPFLFGELRLKNVTHEQLENQRLETSWEGDRIRIPFTIKDVTDWIRVNYFARPASRFATTYFSLIQSLIYQYPDKIDDICNRLRWKNHPSEPK